MFDEYGCGCIVSPGRGRLRFCGSHGILLNDGGKRIGETGPSGKVVRQYPGDGRMPRHWTGR